MIVSMIVAAAEGNVIGVGNRLPWHLPADLARFKSLTMGHHLIMGRRTWEAIGRPLPGRTSVVVSRREHLELEGAVVVSTIDAALALARKAGDDEAFVIGGGEIYRAAMAQADRIYLTRIHGAFEGDTFFPAIEEGEWSETGSEGFESDSRNPYDYEFVLLERRAGVQPAS